MNKKKINWEKQYNELRIMHSILKDLTRKRPKGINIPVWFGKVKKLPKKYSDILWKIDELLYEAEKITVKKF